VPTLWNIFYDGILRLPVHTNVELLAFADDAALVAVAHSQPDLGSYCGIDD